MNIYYIIIIIIFNQSVSCYNVQKQSPVVFLFFPFCLPFSFLKMNLEINFLSFSRGKLSTCIAAAYLFLEERAAGFLF